MEGSVWPVGDVILTVGVAVAAGLTVLAVWQAARADAWGWVASIVLLWPVGLMGWFVAGRRHYR